MREPGRSRRPRRGGRARSDAERRRLAQASRERALDERSGDVVVWCDGGSRGNPGPAAFAYVLDVPGGRSVSASEAIGRATVNVAELRAVLAALAHAGELGLRGVEVRLDARLVAQQLAGERTPRNPELRRLVEAVRQAAVAVRPVRYRWIPREANGRANALVARVLGTAGESA